jgi:hypothetical protein
MTRTSQTITTERLEELLADESIDPVHRALWLLLWEGALPVIALLSLDVCDVILDERKVRPSSLKSAPGQAVEVSERAARLLAEVVGGRTAGPLLAEGFRALSWERAVQVALEHGHGIHAFRTGGKVHRREAE